MNKFLDIFKSMPIGTGGMAAVLGQSEDEILLTIEKLETYGKLFIANDNAVIGRAHV